MTARITVCVPVYNGAGFVAETLESLRRQTLTDFKAVVSIDQSVDGSIDACLPFGGDPRFWLIGQRSRLGWVGNCNFLISKVETEFFCILPHDDVLEPDYLAALLAALDGRPEAVAAYCDVGLFQNQSETIRQPGLSGGRFERVRDYLALHFNAVAFRGLIRKAMAFPGPYFEGNPSGDFAADSLWTLRLAACGELRRVARSLYRKRIHGAAETQRWWRWNDAQAWTAWIDHCAACRRAVAGMDFSPQEQSLLGYAALARLTQSAAPLWTRVQTARLSEPERLAIIARFIERSAESGFVHPATTDPGENAPLSPLAPALADVLAAQLMRRAIEKKPEEKRADAITGSATTGSAMTAEGDPAILRRAAAAAPGSADAWRALSNALLRRNMLAEPIAAALRAEIITDPTKLDDAALRFFAAAIQYHVNRGDYARAAAAAQRRAAAEPAERAALALVARLRALAEQN